MTRRDETPSNMEAAGTGLRRKQIDVRLVSLRPEKSSTEDLTRGHDGIKLLHINRGGYENPLERRSAAFAIVGGRPRQGASKRTEPGGNGCDRQSRRGSHPFSRHARRPATACGRAASQQRNEVEMVESSEWGTWTPIQT